MTFDVGTPEERAPGRWTLNPLARFPLTIAGGNSIIITSLKHALDRSLNGSDDGVDRAFYLFSKHRLRCLEVDAWINDNRGAFFRHLEAFKANSAEYQDLLRQPERTLNRRKKMEYQLRTEAYLALEMRPSRASSALFSDDDHERGLAALDLLVLSYRMSVDATERRRSDDEYRRQFPRTAWRVYGSSEACAHCRKMFDVRPSTEYPTVPVHIGCTCHVSPEQ